jgi:hypothetical protein
MACSPCYRIVVNATKPLKLNVVFPVIKIIFTYGPIFAKAVKTIWGGSAF